MTELEKAARMALEALDSLLDVAMVPMTCEGLCSAESVDKWHDFSFRRDALRTALTQALATAERTLNDTLRDIDAATCPECGGLGVSDPGEPDSPDGPGRAEVPCKPCKGTGWRNGVHLSDQQHATTERKGEPVAYREKITGRLCAPEDTHRRKFPMCYEPLYTSPQVPEDVQRDAERYRFLAEKCRSTSEHWGGRWSIVIEGPAPKLHDSKDDLDAAIDAARKEGQS